MATSHLNSFERAFPRKEMFRGTALASVIFSSLSAVLVCLLLFDTFLVVDLLIRRGEVELQADEVQDYEALTGGGRSATAGLNRIEQGICPTVWANRNYKVGIEFLAQICRSFHVLRDNTTSLTALVLSIVVLGVVNGLFLSRSRNLASRTALNVVTRLRQTLHRQTLRLGPSDLEDRENTYVLNLFTNDMESVRDAIYVRVSRLIRDPLMLVLLLSVALWMNWLLALECLIPLAATWYLVQIRQQRALAASRLAADRADQELRLLAEDLRKTRLVRGYGMEAFERDRFQKHLERFRDRDSQLKQGEDKSRWAIRLLLTICVSVVLFLVGRKLLLEPGNPYHLSFSEALILLVSFACMYKPLERLWRMRVDEERARYAGDRIFRYIDKIPEVGQAVGAKFLQPLSKAIHFESVTYNMANKKKLLDQVDLKVTAGGKTVIVSLDSMEARALVYLLPRFIEPQLGRVLIDGEDIAWMTLESLRAEAIYIGGTDSFFTGTVFENISCGNSKFSLQDVTEASKESHAHNFVLKLPQGYETVLGEHGEQLDTGQNFRLSLARALLRKPALMIVEEPNGQLDEGTKSLLEDAYNRIARDRTLIFLPSQVSTLRRADEIVLLHQGKVAAVGPHAKLVKNSSLYRHWEYQRF